MAFKADTGYIKFLKSGLVQYFGRNASQTLPKLPANQLPLTIFKQSKFTSLPRFKKPLRVIVQVRSAQQKECHESAALEPLIISIIPNSTVDEIVSRILLAIAGELCENAEFMQIFFKSLMKVQRKSKKKHGFKVGEDANQLKNGIIQQQEAKNNQTQSRRSEDRLICSLNLQEQIAKLMCVHSLTLNDNDPSAIIFSLKTAKYIPKIYDLMSLEVFLNPLPDSFCEDIQSLISSTDLDSFSAQQNSLSEKSFKDKKQSLSVNQANRVTNLSQDYLNNGQKQQIISSEFQSMKNNNEILESNVVKNTDHRNNIDDTSRFGNQIQISFDSNDNNRLLNGRQTKNNNEIIKHTDSISLDPKKQNLVFQTENQLTLIDQKYTKNQSEIEFISFKKQQLQKYSTPIRLQQLILPQETRSTDISSHFQEPESYSPQIEPPLKKKRKISSNSTLPKEDEQSSQDSSYSHFVSGLLVTQHQESTPVSSQVLLQSRSEFLGSDSEGIMTSLNNLDIQSSQPSPASNHICQDNKHKDKYIHRLYKSKKQLKHEILSKYNFRLINDSNYLKNPKKISKTNDLSIPIRRQIYERQQLLRVLDDSMHKIIGNNQNSCALQRITSKKEEFECLCQILLVYSRLGNYTSRLHETVIQDIQTQMRTKFIISKQDILSLMTDLELLFPQWIHTEMSEYGQLLQFSHHFTFRYVRNLFKDL